MLGLPLTVDAPHDAGPPPPVLPDATWMAVLDGRARQGAGLSAPWMAWLGVVQQHLSSRGC